MILSEDGVPDNTFSSDAIHMLAHNNVSNTGTHVCMYLIETAMIGAWRNTSTYHSIIVLTSEI